MRGLTLRPRAGRRRLQYQALSAPLAPPPPPPAPDYLGPGLEIPVRRPRRAIDPQGVAAPVARILPVFDARLFPRGAWPEVPPVAEWVLGYQALAAPIKPSVDVLDQGLRFSLFPLAALPVRRRLVRLPGGAVVPVRLADVTATAPTLSWQGRAPEWIARRRGAASGWIAQSWSATIPFLDPTRLQWRGVAPDWLRRASLPVAARPSVVGISPTPWPIPDTSWQGRWPDWLRGAARPVANGGWGWEPFARPNAPSPDSAWQGWYPDRVPAALRLVANGTAVGSVRLLPTLPPNVDSLAQMPGWVARAVVPAARQPRGADRIDVVIPDLRRDWAGSYPDRLARPTRPLTPASTVPAEYNRAIAPLDWYSEDQDPPTILSRLYQRPEAVAPNPELLEGPAVALAWEPAPAWPVVRVWGRAGLVTSAAGVLTPAISAGPVVCVHLEPVAMTSPRLVAPRVTSPGLQFCRLSSPDARGEVC